MTNKLISVAAIALTSAVLATGASAHIKNGALIDGSKQPVLAGDKSCVKVADGSFKSKCHKIKPKVVKAAPAPAPVAAPAPAKPAIISRTATLAGDALFATNSATLSSAGKAALDDFAFRSSALNLTNVDVVGHADSRGNDAYNLDLSVRRAATVKGYLASKGMDASIINASGRGEADPVASNSTREGRAQNRRVEINVTGVRK